MKWYWIALIAGIFAPWVIMGSAIRMGFKERGMLTGLGLWFGVCVLTIPLMFLIVWIARIFI